MDLLDELEDTIANCDKSKYESITHYGYLAHIYNSANSQEYLNRLWRVMEEMGRNPDPLIKVILLMQLPKLVLECGDVDKAQCTQWKLLLEYLVDSDEKVRKSCHLVVLFFLKRNLLPKEIVENHICPTVDQACALYPETVDEWLKDTKKVEERKKEWPLTQEERARPNRRSTRQIGCDFAEEMRDGWKRKAVAPLTKWLEYVDCNVISQPALMSGSSLLTYLMCQMVPLVSKEITERYFLQRFIEMCSHEDSAVREVCVRNFSAMCFAVGSETADVLLLPVFIKLCYDESVYIRYACVNVFVWVACLFSMEKRRNELTAAYLDLLLEGLDSCRILGAFICTFADHAVEKLLANEKFSSEYGLCSQNTDSTVSRLSLLKNDNPSKIFTKDYIDQLFPSFSATDIVQLDDYEDTDPITSVFGISPKFDHFMQFTEADTEKGSPLEAKQSIFEGLDATLHDEDYESEERLHKEADEVEEFNSFRFWHIPPMHTDMLPEAGDCGGDGKIDGDLYKNSEDNGLPERNQEMLDLHVSVLLSVTSPELDMKNSRKLVDSVNQCLAPECSSEESSPSPPSESLPPRTAEWGQNVVPQILLDHFTSMGNNSYVYSHVNQDKPQLCASWIPAVMLTLGPENWPCIRDTHKSLFMCFQSKVKRTIASSLHELASMLGEEITARDLIPIFQACLVESDVAMAALQHLFDFLRHVSPGKRKYLFSRLVYVLNNVHKESSQIGRRMREEVAEQLKRSISLFPPTHCLKYFTPVAVNLLQDGIASVRQKAIELMSHLIVYVKEESNFKTILVNELLLEFASHSSWRRRQLFVLLCMNLAVENVLDAELFSTLFLSHLLKLSKDKVPNVVLRVAQCLSVNFIKNKYISSSNPYFNDIMKILKELETDKDRDVRYYATLHIEDQMEEDEEDDLTLVKDPSLKSSDESLSTV